MSVRPLLQVRSLRAAYGEHVVLSDVELDVEAGACVALLGPNGAGKTTLLHALIGLLPAAAGTVHLDGVRVDTLPAERRVGRGMALVPQGRRIFPSFTTRRNLEVGGFARPDRERVAQDAGALLERFPVLGRRAEAPAGLLSGGEQQLLALGRALMSRPRLLLLDEPSLGLAPLMVRQVFDWLAELRAEGTTMLLVEQNVAPALRLADRVYALAGGRVRSLAPGEAAPAALAAPLFQEEQP